MSDLRGKYAIIGAGNSPLGKVPGVGSLGLFALAAKAAIEDAGIKKEEIDGLLTRGPDEIYAHHQRIGQMMGINATFSTSTDNGGASQPLGVALACMAIDAGLCNTVLVGYSRDSWSRAHRSAEAKMRVATMHESQMRQEFAPEFGVYGAVINYAFAARRHMEIYGTTKEQYGAVAVSFRKHAMKNPDAMMREPMSIEDYLNARMIVDPLGLYDCSLVSDGAGAVIVTSAERAKDLEKPAAYVLGFGVGNNLRGWHHNDNMIHTGAKQAGEAAYKMAGVTPQDIDVAQIYDCFTAMVVLQLEDYGFCKKGEGGAFAASGALDLDGVLPTNTSGGQLSEAHVEGILQVVEGVRQIRHDYGPDRQVKNAELCLVSGHGGNTVCQTALILGSEPN